MEQRFAPSAPLRSSVAYMNFRAVDLGNRVMVRPLYARNAQFLEFYLGQPYRVFDRRSAESHSASGITLVSTNTWRREDLHLTGPLRVFSIHFRPATIHHWLGVPAFELTDRVLDGTDLLGPDAAHLHDLLNGCATGAAMAQTADTWLRARLPVHYAPSIPARIAQAIERSSGAIDLAVLARCAGVSLRHMERLFREQIGITPKHFARITRFQHALQLRAQHPSFSLAELADVAGYYDQAHMNRDVQAFADASPAALLAMLSALAPATARPDSRAAMSEFSKTSTHGPLTLPSCSVMPSRSF